ncbi:MAG: GNAT family N-acetyltransferase, partial [Ruminococcus sp.]|nr:GNAT family N-acetyltransferase [Ruminococcus sp.]
MIRKATTSDALTLARMAIQMWQESTLFELKENFKDCVCKESAACFIKYEEDKPIGFAQCQLRYDYVEGT